MEKKEEDIHCFIDSQEVPLKECDLENQASSKEDSLDSHEEGCQENTIPSGSTIQSIIIKNGSIVEKIFITTDGQRISLKSSD